MKTLSGHHSQELPLPGEIWRIAAGETYSGHAKGSSMTYLMFRLPSASSKAEPMSTVRPSRLGYHDPVLRDSLLELSSQLQGEASESSVSSLVARVSDHLEHEVPVSKGLGLAGSTQERLKELIAQRLVGPIRLGELCSESGLSRSELCRRFGHAFGESPGQYILRQRLRRAAFLLSQHQGDLTEVALECGFSSHSHLTSTFRRLTCVTPSALLQSFR